LDRNDHEAEGSSTGGSDGAPRPCNITIDKVVVLAKARLLVPPDWRLPHGWNVRVAGYTVPPITENDADLLPYIRRRRAALPSWEENNPTCAHESVMWCPVFEADRNS
jgi:hypothetical protein